MRLYSTGLCLLPALLALEGCAEGALGQSRINPNCAPTDLACVVSGFDAPLAEGSTLPVEIHLDLQGSSAPEIELMSGNTTVFGVEGQRIRGSRAGVAALLAMAPGNIVVDFLHVSVAQPSALVLHRRTAEGAESGSLPEKVQLLAGDELRVSVEAYAKSQRLMGELETEWKIDSPAVQLLEDGVVNQRRLVARAPGAATLEVSAIHLDASIELEVVP